MDEGISTLIICIIFTVLAGFTLILRCISRFIIVRTHGSDDYFAILAFLASMALTVLVGVRYPHGMGKDINIVSQQDLLILMKYSWAAVLVYAMAITFLKTSALLQYLRFLVERVQRIICYVILVVGNVFGVVVLVICLFGCQPISYSWDKSVPGGTCVNSLAWESSGAALILATNVIVVALPIWAVRGLNMPRGQKIALMFVFALGGFDICASVIRICTTARDYDTEDQSKNLAPVALWASIEVNVGIICVSLPPLKALVMKLLPTPEPVVDLKPSDLSSSSTSGSGVLQLQPTGSVRSNSTPQAHFPDPWMIP